MADDQVPAEAPVKRMSVLDRFLLLSGYEASAIISSNPVTKVFVTGNGGKYQLGKNGLRRIMGPKYPNETE